MKRRDLLKTGLATIGASTIALSGCSKNKEQSIDVDIVPKQTAKYEFSLPLPFNYEIIDEIAELNSKIKKLQVKILYNSIPQPLVDKYNGYVHLIRSGENKSIKSLDDFGQYVKYATDRGFHFVYLMNSTKSFTEQDFLAFRDDFLYLLEYLKKIGCRDIKVGCAQVADILDQYAPKEFNWHVSTCYELHSIKQFKNLFRVYPKFNFIDLAHGETQNFTLLRNLRKQYPDKKIEIMINETCPKGCPKRLTRACKNNCKVRLDKSDIVGSFIKIGSVFPWDMEYYSAIGVNNFKFVSVKDYEKSHVVDLVAFKKLVDIIENGYENYKLQDLVDSTWIPAYIINDKNKDIKLSDIAPLFPDIKYLIKHGALCDSVCQVQCNYCFNHAVKLKKALMLG